MSTMNQMNATEIQPTEAVEAVLTKVSLQDYFSESGEKYNTDSIEELIKEFKDGYHYLKGQIVEVSLTWFGRIPVIVTNVNQPDENGHFSYDIIILLGERNKSFIESKNRYLWRFTEKANEQTPENIQKLTTKLFTREYQYGELFKDINLEELCYQDGDQIVKIPVSDLPQFTPVLNGDTGTVGKIESSSLLMKAANDE